MSDVVVICPGCGTTVREWWDEEGDDALVVEHEDCPMCAEALMDEMIGGWW